MKIAETPGDKFCRRALSCRSRSVDCYNKLPMAQFVYKRKELNIRKHLSNRKVAHCLPYSYTRPRNQAKFEAGRPMRKLTHQELSSKRLSKEGLENTPRMPVIGILDNIRSLYNVGSMFRTSDGAFVRGLYLCGYTPHPPRKELDKTALGATETVPWQYFSSPEGAIAAARAAGARLCVVEQTTGSVPYFTIQRSDFPICLVIGNEIAGVSRAFIEAADMAIEIPMYGVKQSLNAAVAYGIAVFEMAKIWRGG
jgi:23S rRNA (guanosine2251-2'-O)-methyltransferase